MDHHSMESPSMDDSSVDKMYSPAPSPGQHAGHGMHGHMMMSMQMWFQASCKTTLWFKEWKVHTHGVYAASMIGLIILCLVQEGLSRLRTSIARQYSLQSSSEDAENAAVVHPETASPPFFGRMYNPPAVRIALSLLYALNLTTSYLLMLAVMTYNVGYFLAIICGLALGHLIFFPAALAKAPTAPSNCC